MRPTRQTTSHRKIGLVAAPMRPRVDNQIIKARIESCATSRKRHKGTKGIRTCKPSPGTTPLDHLQAPFPPRPRVRSWRGGSPSYVAEDSPPSSAHGHVFLIPWLQLHDHRTPPIRPSPTTLQRRQPRWLASLPRPRQISPSRCVPRLTQDGTGRGGARVSRRWRWGSMRGSSRRVSSCAVSPHSLARCPLPLWDDATPARLPDLLCPRRPRLGITAGCSQV